MQPHSLSRFRVEPKQSGGSIHAGGLRVGVHGPILRNVVPHNEDRRLVRRILHDVFLLGHSHKEPGTLPSVIFSSVWWDDNTLSRWQMASSRKASMWSPRIRGSDSGWIRHDLSTTIDNRTAWSCVCPAGAASRMMARASGKAGSIFRPVMTAMLYPDDRKSTVVSWRLYRWAAMMLTPSA